MDFKGKYEDFGDFYEKINGIQSNGTLSNDRIV